MNPGNAEQNPPEKSMQQQPKEIADQIIAEMHASYNDKYADLTKIKDDNERAQKRAQLDKQIRDEFGSRVIDQIARDTSETSQTNKPEDVKEKAKNAKRIFLEAKVLSDRGISTFNKKSQVLVDKIVEKIKTGEITDQGVLAIERNLGKQLIEGVVFSKPGEQLSATEEGLKNLIKVDPLTASQIYNNIVTNPETYGTTAEILNQKLELQTPENIDNLQREQQTSGEMGQRGESRFGYDGVYYETRFTKPQKNLIASFYSPEKFVDYMEKLRDGYDSAEGRQLKHTTAYVQKEKAEIKKRIEDHYKSKNEPLSEEKLKDEIEEHWGEEVSKEMDWRVSDVINQLFLELQQKSPYKFYEEIMQEDPFYGPEAIQRKIQTAINSLMTKIDQIERNKDDKHPLYERLNNLKLYRYAAESYIDEREGKAYPRLRPLTYSKKIGTRDFIQQINTTIDHTIQKASYFHNSRAIYGHPAGEKGFYNQLGGFAESLHGTDIDEIMLLPDGQYIMQAYQLYEKMLEEDLASLDWRHRPDQMTNEIERVNSKIEQQVFAQLEVFYPDLTKDRLRNIVNSAIGIGRGMFLTEPEKLAYTDPVDADGIGMVASYSTNDATSLNVFNPLQTALRWQGEHNWNMMYFMPVEGQPGIWDHKTAWKNMAKYMDSFMIAQGQGSGKEKLPEVFAEALIDINNVGGVSKRKGWRMSYSLDGHYIFEKNAQGVSTNKLNVLSSFKAMEAIGYEALFDFVNSQVPERTGDLLKSTKGPLADQRNKWFKYMYERYFDQNKSFNDYLDELGKKGEEKAYESVKKGSNNSWEEQVQLETSKLFMDNFIAHYVAERFPTKFLRIDRNRFTEDGKSRWQKVYEVFKEKGWSRGKFDMVIKDMTMAEMLLRRQISEKIRENISFDTEWTLDRINEIKDLPYRLTEEKIRELLSTNTSKDKNNNTFKSPEEINDVITLWKHIKSSLNDKEFLDNEGIDKIRKYTFTFGLEDTDISLIAYRGTGPRMVARTMKDIGLMEENITKWIIQMPRILSEIAINGKHDFSPIIEYLRKGQQAIFDVHGTLEAQKFVYKVAGTVINYFKKDSAAKPFFGLFGLGKRNSIAAEYAGRSTAIWEWDSRDIDRFCVSLESYRLLPHNPYDLNKTERTKLVDGKLIKGRFTGGEFEDRWIKLPFLKHPIKFGKRRHVDWEWNGKRLRKDHGADWKAISWDMLNQYLPIAIAFLLWKYIKDAMDEVSGKKK